MESIINIEDFDYDNPKYLDSEGFGDCFPFMDDYFDYLGIEKSERVREMISDLIVSMNSGCDWDFKALSKDIDSLFDIYKQGVIYGVKAGLSQCQN